MTRALLLLLLLAALVLGAGGVLDD